MTEPTVVIIMTSRNPKVRGVSLKVFRKYLEISITSPNTKILIYFSKMMKTMKMKKFPK